MAALRCLAPLVACATFALGCGHRDYIVESSNKGTAQKKARTLTAQDIEAVLAAVPVARQLEIKRRIQIDRLEEKAFRRLLRDEHIEESTDEGLTPDSALLMGFNFLPPPEKRAELASHAAALEEEIAGFYDIKADRIVVPLVPLKNEKDDLMQRAVLAHEVQHALQAQHFPPKPEAKSEDQALAHLALWEGDAVVAMGAYIGTDLGAPVGRTLRRIADATRDVSRDRLTHGKTGRSIDRTLPLFREQLAFPYEEGMLFVTDLYRAGGFPLIDQAFKAPPTTTMHVLHPAKYLAGERPRPFADAQLPNGFRVVAAGELGELRTRIFFTQCLDRAQAEAASAGWAGDRYTVAVDDERRLAVGWASAWDSPAEAEEFEKAARSAKPCFSANRLGAEIDYAIGEEISVSRQNDVVVITRGALASSPAYERALLASAQPKPVNQPLSAARIPPRETLPEPRPGKLEDDVYWNTWLGITGRVPKGMVAEVGGDLDFVVHRTQNGVYGGLGISTRVASDEQNEKTFREMYKGLRAAVDQHVGGLVISRIQTGDTKTALGAGVERVWAVENTPLRLRMVLIPVCAGTGSIVVAQLYADKKGKKVLDGWLESFRFTDGRALEACRYLDPK
jgi:hypothetical protein